MDNSAQNDSSIQDSFRDPLIGTVFDGKYKFLSALGAGGMSSVYKAHHLHLDKDVALKLLHSRYAGRREAVLRFQQEAKTVAALKHPHIVSVQDFGLTESGEAFIVMDCLEGTPLSSVLEKHGHLSGDQTVRIIRQVLDGLAYAHQAGIIHRDLKPSNIILSGDLDNCSVTIVDFGIAKLISDDAQQLTRTGEVFGSPPYMSPEQCSGAVLDARSDIYSLGCLMYECLVGLPPFKGDNVIQTFNKHLSEPAPLFSEAAPNVVTSDVLEDVVLKALEKDPKRRFQSAAEFMDALDRSQTFTGNSFLPKQWRKKVVKFLEPKRTLNPRDRLQHTAKIAMVYLLLSVPLIAFVPPLRASFVNLFESIMWQCHYSSGSHLLHMAERLMKDSPESRETLERAVTELRQSCNDLQNIPDNGMRLCFSHGRLSKALKALHRDDEAQKELAIAKSFSPKELILQDE